MVSRQSPRIFRALAASLLSLGASALAAPAAADQPLDEGSVRVHIVETEGKSLIGGYYRISQDLGGGTMGDAVFMGSEYESGYLQVSLAPGDYILEEMEAPDAVLIDSGPFSQSDDYYPPSYGYHRFSVDPGSTTDMTLVHERSNALILHRVDDDGNSIPTGCIEVVPDLDVAGGDPPADAHFNPPWVLCNDQWSYWNDGLRLVLPEGVRIVDLYPPQGFMKAADVLNPGGPGEDVHVSFTSSAIEPFAVYTVDADGMPALGACFQLVRPDGSVAEYECDYSAPDWVDDGAVRFVGAQPGTYTLRSFRDPWFCAPVADREVVIGDPVRGSVTVEVSRSPMAYVHVIDENNDPLPGACFSLFQRVLNEDGSVQRLLDEEVCDQYDGETDGVIFLGAPEPGTYEIVQYDPYVSGWNPPHMLPDGIATFTIADQDVHVMVATSPEELWPTPGVYVHTYDSSSEPAAGACYYALSWPALHEEDWGDGPFELDVAFYGCDADDGAEDGVVSISGLYAHAAYVISPAIIMTDEVDNEPLFWLSSSDEHFDVFLPDATP